VRDIRFTYTPLGDSAIMIGLNFENAGSCSEMSGLVADKIRALNMKGVTDIVPAFRQLAVHYDPIHWMSSSSKTPYDEIVRYLNGKLNGIEVVLDANDHKTVRIPVCYDKTVGLDLAALSSTLKTSVSDLINLHHSKTYIVGAIGFAPGFAYLEGLDTLLTVSRRREPRTRVPAGSVAVAGGYTGIYPSVLPGGWHILGRTHASLFQKTGSCGALLSVGDQVRFEPISIEEFAVEQDLKEKQ
jgi:inhibitor of KinA